MHEEALELVDVWERHAANLRNKLISVVGVVEHLRGDQDSRQNQSAHRVTNSSG